MECQTDLLMSAALLSFLNQGNVQDLLATLRPTLERLTLFEEAVRAVAAIEASEARSAAAGPAGLGIIEEEDSASDDSADGSGSDSDAGGTQQLHPNISLSVCGSRYLLCQVHKLDADWNFHMHEINRQQCSEPYVLMTS